MARLLWIALLCYTLLCSNSIARPTATKTPQNAEAQRKHRLNVLWLAALNRPGLRYASSKLVSSGLLQAAEICDANNIVTALDASRLDPASYNRELLSARMVMLNYAQELNDLERQYEYTTQSGKAARLDVDKLHRLCVSEGSRYSELEKQHLKRSVLRTLESVEQRINELRRKLVDYAGSAAVEALDKQLESESISP